MSVDYLEATRKVTLKSLKLVRNCKVINCLWSTLAAVVTEKPVKKVIHISRLFPAHSLVNLNIVQIILPFFKVGFNQGII